MFLVAVRHAFRLLKSRKRTRFRGVFALGALDALLDLANGDQVLVEFLAVVAADLPGERPGVLQHEIEDAFLVALAPGQAFVAFALSVVAKEAFENQTRVGLLGHRCGAVAP